MRLIVVPQYPAQLRYQSWWLTRLEDYYLYFDKVLILHPPQFTNQAHLSGEFAPAMAAIDYEVRQISLYNQLVIDEEDDILLLCDISFPGLFSSVLFHKRPKKCFAICHATSLNRYDYFAAVRPGKWRVETGTSKIFDKIFVASEYHKERLGWKNTVVIKFPLPKIDELVEKRLSKEQQHHHSRSFISVARKGVQKIDLELERFFEWSERTSIHRFYQTKGKTWTDYYGFVEAGRFMIITSREETYGYQVIDALSVGTIPLAPRALSYPELLPDENLYEPGRATDLIDTYKRYGDKPAPPLWEDKFFEFTATEMKR